MFGTQVFKSNVEWVIVKKIEGVELFVFIQVLLVLRVPFISYDSLLGCAPPSTAIWQPIKYRSNDLEL